MKHRDKSIYSARLSGLRFHAFGYDRIAPYEADIEIYQARSNPEVWRARPFFKHAQHVWEAGSKQALMELVEADFAEKLTPWTLAEETPVKPRPSLRSSSAAGDDRRAS